MPHFYVKPEDINNGIFTMDNEQAHYLSTVRRFNAGDEIMIFDGKGNSYKGQIKSVSKTRVEGKILSSSYSIQQTAVKLYSAIPKGDRFEWLIEKAAELGVSEIIPINTKRSVTVSFSESKAQRYEKISIAASSQCGRNDIMKISEPVSFESACKTATATENSISILPWESEEHGVSINNLFHGDNQPETVNIFIGPEGGFENEEAEYAKSLGVKTVSLGKNILRTETAAIAAGILVLNFLENHEKNK